MTDWILAFSGCGPADERRREARCTIGPWQSGSDGRADLIRRCFTGLATTGDVLRCGPGWPAKLGSLRMVLRYRGHRPVAEVSSTAVALTVDPRPGPAIAVRCYGHTRLLEPGDTHTWTPQD